MVNALRSTSHSPFLRSAARFAVVGLLGTTVDMTLFAAFLALGIATLPGNLLSYSAGIANNFLLHRRWTFSAAAGAPALPQFARFAAVSFSALAVNTLVVLLLAPILGALPAKVCAIAVGLCWNFAANHAWTFR